MGQKYQIQLIKTRSSGGVGSKIDLAFDIDRLRITDLNEDDVEIIPTSSDALVQSIKKRSSTVTEKSEASVVAEKTEITKGLRDLLKSQRQTFDNSQ